MEFWYWKLRNNFVQHTLYEVIRGNYLKNEIFNLNQIAPTSGFITYGEFFHDSKSCNNNLLNLTTTYVVLDENKENKPLKFEDIDIKKDNREVTLKALTNLISKTNEDLEENIYYRNNFVQHTLYEVIRIV